jgi:transcriptional regulator of acetoin/glycerol metabolism
MERLIQYRWPGNVRELRNTLESMLVLAEDEVMTERDLPDRIRAGVSSEGGPTKEVPSGLTMDALEKLAITRALDQCAGNRTHAAGKLGISVRTLQRKLRQYELESGGGGQAPQNDILTQA